MWWELTAKGLVYAPSALEMSLGDLLGDLLFTDECEMHVLFGRLVLVLMLGYPRTSGDTDGALLSGVSLFAAKWTECCFCQD